MKPAKKKPIEKTESIWESEYRMKQEAKDISKNHIDVKPIKYLIK